VRIGVVFPQSESSTDPAALRRYATTVEQLGYRHILAYDHVVGADPNVYEGWNGPYDVDTTFHEPFVLFGYLAAVTKVELVTGIIILPQRQTALVAKQAAEVDILTEGRFRLGIGVGWNPVEYETLGQDFHTRGRRSGEQVDLLRRLWTERTVTAQVDDEKVVGAGIAPLPVQRPIPVWFGAASPPAFRRAGRLGDGWFPQVPPGHGLEEAKAIVDAGAEEAGRDPASIGMEGRVNYGDGGVEKVLDHVGRWREAGATHLSINTMHAGLAPMDAHVEALAELAGALGLTPEPETAEPA
jgi:probable F420-dependent oxidoreductase